MDPATTQQQPPAQGASTPPPAAQPPAGAPPPVAAGAPPPASSNTPPAAAPASGPAGAPQGQPPADASKNAPADQGNAAPAAFEIKLPEGAKFDDKVLGEFKTLMSDEKLTSAQRAQALIDLQWKQAQAQTKAANDAWEAQKLADVEALKTDKEFGGVKYDATVKAAQSALQQFGGEEASKLLTAFGLENNPAVVKLLARVRSAIAEDSLAGKSGQAPQVNTREAQLQSRYDKSPTMFRK